MALRMKGRSGQTLDQLEYDIFWTEYRAIEESRIPVPDEEHDEEPSKEPPGGTFFLINFIITKATEKYKGIR